MRLEDLFLAWKCIVAFKGGKSVHERTLKAKALKALSRYRKGKKVKQFRYRIAAAHHAKALIFRVFGDFKRAVALEHEHRQAERRATERAQAFHEVVLMSKATKAWKLQAYRMRVLRYFHSRLLHRHGTQFFSNLREKFFVAKTERLREERAVTHHS